MKRRYTLGQYLSTLLLILGFHMTVIPIIIHAFTISTLLGIAAIGLAICIIAVFSIMASFD